MKKHLFSIMIPVMVAISLFAIVFGTRKTDRILLETLRSRLEHLAFAAESLAEDFEGAWEKKDGEWYFKPTGGMSMAMWELYTKRFPENQALLRNITLNDLMLLETETEQGVVVAPFQCWSPLENKPIKISEREHKPLNHKYRDGDFNLWISEQGPGKIVFAGEVRRWFRKSEILKEAVLRHDLDALARKNQKFYYIPSPVQEEQDLEKQEPTEFEQERKSLCYKQIDGQIFQAVTVILPDPAATTTKKEKKKWVGIQC